MVAITAITECGAPTRSDSPGNGLPRPTGARTVICGFLRQTLTGTARTIDRSIRPFHTPNYRRKHSPMSSNKYI